MNTKIRDFIESGKDGSIEIPLLPLGRYHEYLKSLGYKSKEFDDLNGWQVDFWLYFYKDNRNICIAGSLWHGNYTLTIETINNVTSKD